MEQDSLGPMPEDAGSRTPLSPGRSGVEGEGVRRLARRRRNDRGARAVVTVAGIGIIAVILGILVFIVGEVLPLLSPAKVEPAGVSAFELAGVRAVLCDDYVEEVAVVLESGVLALLPVAGGEVRGRFDLVSGRSLPEGEGVRLRHGAATPDGKAFAALAADGRLFYIPAGWRTTFGEARTVEFQSRPAIALPLAPEDRVHAWSVRSAGSSGARAIASLEDGTLVKLEKSIEIDDFTEEETEISHREVLGAGPRLKDLSWTYDSQRLFALREDGAVGFFDISAQGIPSAWTSRATPATTAVLLKGETSLLTGHEDGEIVQWQIFAVDGRRELVAMRTFEGKGSAVVRIAPSHRHKGFMVLDAAGNLALYHTTSGRLLWEGPGPIASVSDLLLSPRDDAAILVGEESIAVLSVDNPHPEAGFRAFFGKIWYEGYPGPAHVWQSSSGNDGYEPKLGVVPLIAGTLKGTLFSLIFAVPIAVLAALYASQFMHPTLRGRVKPAIEIMAAVPSVVLGFVAGLWLAQKIHRVIPGLVLLPVILPAMIILGGILWNRFPAALRERFRMGAEVVFFALFSLLGVGICISLSPFMESALFGGDFPNWLREWMGLAYDQQNAIVVSIAMGFAVIPIIFTIAEEAFSAVPRSLPLGSLALGATPWQTVVRIVVPTASPGVFSAVMVGFGRAVGETMIVLMAAGNTPIMDWNPFLGFRTLSANIATEIPEAPVGGTLYRTLFLAALLLFILTFFVNTLAEVVRGRLRQRYANL